jgi:hypothetical protein
MGATGEVQARAVGDRADTATVDVPAPDVEAGMPAMGDAASDPVGRVQGESRPAHKAPPPPEWLLRQRSDTETPPEGTTSGG